MNHADRVRHWQGCQNVRDLGGLITAHGIPTRSGALFRADLLAKLTPQGWRALADQGINTIIDLRGTDEARNHAYQIPSDLTPIHYHNLPIEQFLPHVSARIMQARSRAEVYTIILESYPTAIAQIMRTIITAPEGGVVFHCHAGKDRTGTIAALLLDLVGVSRDQIAEDYALSQHYLPTPPRVGPLPDGVDPANDFWHQPTATATVAWQMLTWIDDTYGGSAAYLGACGLHRSEISALQARISAQP